MSRGDDLPPSEWSRFDYADQPEADTWDASAERCPKHGFDCGCYLPDGAVVTYQEVDQ